MSQVTVGRVLWYAPVSFDMEAIRIGLLQAGTTCEFIGLACETQAVTVHLGVRAVVFLCDDHADLVAEDEALAVRLENYIWQWYNSMFNIYRINEQMNGTFVETMAAIQADMKTESRDKATAMKRERREMIKEMNRLIKIGVPDDELARSRKEQSPSRDANQPVIRNPDSNESDLIPAQLI